MEADPNAIAATALAFFAGGYGLAVAIRRFRIRTADHSRCAFCNRPREQARVLVAAESVQLGQVYICERCIAKCAAMVEERLPPAGPAT